MVIWDGSPIHRREVTQFMATEEAKDISLEQLPSYAPDLNADEGVWQHLKNVELRNVCCKNLIIYSVN
jgi:transposase